MSISKGSAGSESDLSNTTFEARLEARLEGALEDFGQAYNSVEDRVYILESASPSYSKRIATLEEIIRPFENYGKKTQEAVNELVDLKKKFQTAKTGMIKALDKNLQTFANQSNKKFVGLSHKIDEIHAADLTKIEERLQEFAADMSHDMTSALAESSAKMDGMAKRLDDLPAVDDHQADINASVQTLLERVSKLESKTSSPESEAKPLSTNDMAQALISRLAQGEQIDNATLARLREVMPTSITSGVKENAAALPPLLPPTQVLGPAVSAAGKAEIRSASRPSQQRKRTLDQSNAGNDESDEAATNDVRERRTAEIRRSARTPKPNKKHASFLTWIEVRERRKTK